MVDHERPYFDHVEQLEYPTETWGAQELRKANALRMAAPFADEPLRLRILEKGAALAERAWSDLLRFESRHVARATAILLTEGVRDAAFNAGAIARAPRVEPSVVFPDKEHFMPQRERVRQRLTRASQTAGNLRRLLTFRCWRTLVLEGRHYL
jgi:hypothetical protein